MSVLPIIGIVVSAGLIVTTFVMVIRLRNAPPQPVGYSPPSVEPEWQFKRKVHVTIIILLFAAAVALFVYSDYWIHALYRIALEPNPSIGRVYPRALWGSRVVYLTHAESLYFSLEWYLFLGLSLSAWLLNRRWKALPNPAGGIPTRLY
jgi:hypothetical protein